MALYRTISMSFWTDAKVVDDFTPEDRYFYLYLFTNPHTNLCGCYEISITQMSNEIGYNKDSVERLIKRFIEVHDIIRYSKETKEILLLNWHKYNWTKSDKFRKPLLKEIDGIKSSEFKVFLSRIEQGEKIRYGIGTKCTDTSVTNTNTITDTVTNSKKNNAQKHKYGEYENVLLTDDEYLKLQELFPDLNERIERLSEYVASTGKSYKSHYATIRSWSRKERQKPITGSYKSQQFSVDEQRIASWAERRNRND